MVISNSVTAHGTEDAAVVYGDPFGWEKRVRGSLPCNKTAFTIEAALPDPALLCAESLRQALADKGIQSRSAASTYTETATGTKAVHVHRSPALHALVAHTNLHSDNLYAESLVRAVGKGNYADGLAMIRNFWKTRGLDITQLFMTDGSGLSRASTVTTDLQSAMLCAIRADSLLFKDIQRSLPAAGVHGSMRSIGKGTFIENNLRAKTGYITRVRAYCGYVTTRKERELAFSVIFNSYNCTPSEARKKIESFLVGLADF